MGLERAKNNKLRINYLLFLLIILSYICWIITYSLYEEQQGIVKINVEKRDYVWDINVWCVPFEIYHKAALREALQKWIDEPYLDWMFIRQFRNPSMDIITIPKKENRIWLWRWCRDDL
jgi:hypothetical protein